MSDETNSRSRGLRCRYRAFLRLCFTEDFAPLEAIRRAAIGGKNPGALLNKLRNGEAIAISNYKSLAKVLNCEPTNLCYLRDENVLQIRSAPFRYARRVADLIEDGSIPELDPETGDNTDVVQFAWLMGDPVLDSISMTHEQEREAFLILRDHFLMVTERPYQTTGPHRKMIGKMEIAPALKEEILSDLDARFRVSSQAFDYLKEKYESDDHFHINRIQIAVPQRFELYLNAVEQDRETDRRTEGDVLVKEKTVNAVIDADSYLRMTIFPTHQQDATFLQFYGRSRRLVQRAMEIYPQEFISWWPLFRDANTADLEVFVDGWKSRSGQPPKWEKMNYALSKTIERTKESICRFYPDPLGSSNK